MGFFPNNPELNSIYLALNGYFGLFLQVLSGRGLNLTAYLQNYWSYSSTHHTCLHSMHRDLSQPLLTTRQPTKSDSSIVPEEMFHVIDNLYCLSSTAFTFKKGNEKHLASM
jgi:hypothetical protein